MRPARSRVMRVAIAFLLTVIVLWSPPWRTLALQPTPLRLVLTPSQSPTSLQESGEEFARVFTQLVETPVKVYIASDCPGVIEAFALAKCRSGLCASGRLRPCLPRGWVSHHRQGYLAWEDKFYSTPLGAPGEPHPELGRVAWEDDRLCRSRLQLWLYLSHGYAHQARHDQKP